jgi:integrase
VKLPTSIANAKDFKSCGAAFRQYLDRHPFWQSLIAENKGLVPYSLRHGYAWRGAKYKHYKCPIPLRDLAALMGHDSKTHHKHYGQFTTDEDIEESVLRSVGTLMEARSGQPS